MESDSFFIITFKRPLSPGRGPEKALEATTLAGLVGGLVGGLAESQKKIYEAMRDNPSISKTELAKILGISMTAIDENISVLKRKSLIRRIGLGTGGHWEVNHT